MAAGKEQDSNFFIFLPQVFTNDPVSDIEQGSRNSCYAGERLCFFLIAQFRGKNREDAKFKAWQKRLLRICTCVSVSSIDLMIRKDDPHEAGLITCWPVRSSRVDGKETNLRKKVRSSAQYKWICASLFWKTDDDQFCIALNTIILFKFRNLYTTGWMIYFYIYMTKTQVGVRHKLVWESLPLVSYIL